MSRDRCNIEHKFWDGRCVQTFWEAIKNWLVTNQILETGLNLNAQTVLLGLGASTLVNHVIVLAKTIIAKREYLSLRGVINRLRADCELEQMAALCKGIRENSKRSGVVRLRRYQ